MNWTRTCPLSCFQQQQVVSRTFLIVSSLQHQQEQQGSDNSRVAGRDLIAKLQTVTVEIVTKLGDELYV